MQDSGQEMASRIEEIRVVVEQNSSAAREMQAPSSAVERNIQSIAAVAEENSAATEEVSASTEEMAASAEEMTAGAGTLRQQVVEVQRASDSLGELYEGTRSAGRVIQDWLDGCRFSGGGRRTGDRGHGVGQHQQPVQAPPRGVALARAGARLGLGAAFPYGRNPEGRGNRGRDVGGDARTRCGRPHPYPAATASRMNSSNSRAGASPK